MDLYAEFPLHCFENIPHNGLKLFGGTKQNESSIQIQDKQLLHRSRKTGIAP